MPHQKLEVISDGTSLGTHVLVDGVRLEHVQDAYWHVSAGEIARLDITILMSPINASVGVAPEVVLKCDICGHVTDPHTCEGPTP